MKAKGLQRFKDVIEVTERRIVPEWLDVDYEAKKGTPAQVEHRANHPRLQRSFNHSGSRRNRPSHHGRSLFYEVNKEQNTINVSLQYLYIILTLKNKHYYETERIN